MSIGCNCASGLSNTGRPNCVSLQSVTSKLIMVPLFAADGTANYIDLSIALPVWATLINEADATKRWFPLPNFENVELPKADSQFEEANSGRMVFLRQGKRSFAGELWAEDSTPTLLGKLQNNRCVDFGVYIVDVNGNLVGSKHDGGLYPIPVDNPSFNPTFTFATDSTTQKIMLGFDFDRLFDESTMYMITPTEAGVNFNDLNGLVDVNLINEVITAGDITFDAVLDYGTALNPIKFSGAVTADFLLYNNTTTATVTITAVENIPLDGNYTVTYVAGVTAADSLTLSIDKDGFDGELTYVAV
jgi:hypothetical protein